MKKYIIAIGDNYLYDSIFKIIGGNINEAKLYDNKEIAAKDLKLLRRDFNLRIMSNEIIEVEVFLKNSR